MAYTKTIIFRATAEQEKAAREVYSKAIQGSMGVSTSFGGDNYQRGSAHPLAISIWGPGAENADVDMMIREMYEGLRSSGIHAEFLSDPVERMGYATDFIAGGRR